MSFRPFSLTCAALLASLVGTSLPLFAQPEMAPPPPPAGNEGGFRPGGEGGFRGQGGRGGGRMMTPEQRQRLLGPYLAAVPDLTPEQQNHILAIVQSANAEIRAARQNAALTPQGVEAATNYVRADVANHVRFALTEKQQATYDPKKIELLPLPPQGERGGFGPGGGAGEGGPRGGGEGGFGPGGDTGESADQLRDRLFKGYEPVLDELSVKQKTQLLEILKNADAETRAINADAAKTPEQKSAALQQVQASVNTKVPPLLDADQRKLWEKAQAAKRP